MPAPTARLAAPAAEIAPEQVPLPVPNESDPTDELSNAILSPFTDSTLAPTSSPPTFATDPSNEMDLTTPTPTTTVPEGSDLESRPTFPSLSTTSTPAFRSESRKVSIPAHRLSPLKREWPLIYPPLVEHLNLQVRMNPARKIVEIRTSKGTTDPGASLQKGEDFVRSFVLGFDVADAIAFLRLDDLYVETFEIKDVKTLEGDHLGRAIGRIAGKDGKTKLAIENATRTRIALADSKIHILGAFQNIHMARESIVDLIRGKQPGKVYGNLQKLSRRLKERF